MDILRVKVNGEWIGIPSIKGDKGDKGDTGVAGPKGDTGLTGPQGPKGDKGDPFTVKKTFASIAEMEAYSGSDVSEGDFVCITSTVEDPDNGKLYVKAANGWLYITDLSGATGMKGDKGDKGDKGNTGAQGPKGDQGDPVDVQINGTSIVSQGIANIPIGTANTYGVYRTANSNEIKNGVDACRVNAPIRQHESTFYGLAKAAGDSTQAASNNAVGTYTDEAKTAIKTMLGVSEPASIIDDTAGTGDTDKVWSADKLTTELSGKVDKTNAVINSSLSMGRAENSTVGENSTALGYNVTASGANSVAVGAGTTASGSCSYAEGAGSVASGSYSHAEGTQTTASGNYSHAEGAGTFAIGQFSHVEGGSSSANGYYSHAEGGNTIANHAFQHVFGQYNVADPSDALASERGNYVEIVGNGVYNARSNARTLDWYGNEILYGDLTVKKGTADEVSITGLINVINGKYQKPSGGIPLTDLQTVVQTSIGKADTAYQKPSGGIPASDLASGVIPSVPVQDVQIEGTSILDVNGIAKMPRASYQGWGVARFDSGGFFINNSGSVLLNRANSTEIKKGTSDTKPLVPNFQHYATFYGLAKASGDTTQSSSSNAVGTYTPEAKAAIWQMLGLDGSAFVKSDWELIREDTFTNATEADHIITVDGNGNALSITSAIMLFELPNTDTASSKGYYGQIWFYYGDTVHIEPEPSAYSRNANDAAKGAWYKVEYNNGLVLTEATPATTNTNSTNLRMRFIHSAHASADSQMGVFVTNDFEINKINIKSVTGTGHYKLYGKRKRNGLDSPVINVSGTTPSITALPGHRYVCGECSTLSITVPASGCIDVMFDSGTTATALTITPPTGQTVKWANGFNPTSLEANTTYELNIMDLMGVAGTWT